MPRQFEARPIASPVTPPIPQPERRIITTLPSTKENNVYVAPNGNIMRSTPQGWQQRDQNTWKKAGETPAKQAIVHDSNVRQRAAERSSSPKTSTPAPKRSSDNKDRKR
jgi:hypothetical protein